MYNNINIICNHKSTVKKLHQKWINGSIDLIKVNGEWLLTAGVPK